MSMAVLHVNSSSANSTSPTMRIAKFVSSELGIPLIHDPETAKKHLSKKFDVLFVKYGMLKFSDHREEALHIYNNAKKVVNLENDYTFVSDKRFRPADEVWSTVEERTRYVNWNVLTRRSLDAWKKPPPLRKPTESGLFYYGALREGRLPYFEKYLASDKYSVTISSFRSKKFAGMENAKLMGPFRDQEMISQWPATVYIEDERSHDLYCSPANRFYECLIEGLTQLIDIRADNTLRRAGVPSTKRFLVGSDTEVARFLKKAGQLQVEQRDLWMRDYAGDIRQQFADAVKQSGVK